MPTTVPGTNNGAGITRDFLGFDGQKGSIRDFAVCSIRALCVSRRIDTWQIVDLNRLRKPVLQY